MRVTTHPSLAGPKIDGAAIRSALKSLQEYLPNLLLSESASIEGAAMPETLRQFREDALLKMQALSDAVDIASEVMGPDREEEGSKLWRTDAYVISAMIRTIGRRQGYEVKFSAKPGSDGPGVKVLRQALIAAHIGTFDGSILAKAMTNLKPPRAPRQIYRGIR
jgi:hypothetical protein